MKKERQKKYNRSSDETAKLIEKITDELKLENPDKSEFDITQMAVKKLREDNIIR
jgi:hypothetical protein